ncbi:MAG: diaminobutyrate acetyltransferase, partial [Candidatus Competibacterales bacterium]|nr:diaminobutyrate acetyltransferase [Candidatus Competibacterales bacterium]
PLDLNSVYNYLILCKHFRETCVVVEEQGEIIAFTSGYIPPATPEALFIWQVAVGPKARKRGFGKRLLGELIKRPVCRNVRYLETTITPSNKASWSLFKSFARDLGTDWNDDTLFEGEHFGESGHEPEQLLRIGPFRADSPQRLAKSS